MDDASVAGMPRPQNRYCPGCGTSNSGERHLCLRCGTRLTPDGGNGAPADPVAAGTTGVPADPAVGHVSGPPIEPRKAPPTTAAAMGMALLRAAPSSVVVMDMAGRITMLNAAAERLFAVRAGEAEGKLYPDVFGPSLANRIVALFLRATRPGAAGAAHTLAATLPDGRRATLRANAGPLHDGGGTVAGVFFVADEYSDAREPTGEKEARLRQALQRYVGDTIAARIADHPSFVGVGGKRQVVSVLHADVRGYTTLAEALEPEEVSRLLIIYHGKAVAALGSEQATIDRYVGDAILALWNAPAPQEAHARLAIRGALAMRQVTQAVGRDLEYGIGLHTGEAVVGNLGSAEYMHYTAIGDTVNVAARLQSAAPAGGIVCSAATLDAAGAGVRATPLGDLAVKGRKGTVRAFAVEGIEA